MDYTLTQEQQMIKESVARLLEKDYDFLQRCKWLSKGQRFQDSIWNQFAQLGLCSLPFSAEYGGFDASATDMSVVAESMGKYLVVEPFLPCYLASCYLSSCASEKQKKQYIPDVCSGQSRIVMALDLSCSDVFLSDYQSIQCSQVSKNQWVLSGSSPMVCGLDNAHHVIVFSKNEKNKIIPFIVPCDAVKIQKFSLIDDSGASQLILDNVKVTSDQQLNYQDVVLTELHIRSIAFLSSEAVAIMQVLNEKTKRYLKDRQQFGQPLSKFQLLQHRLVEMYVQEEQARSMSLTLNFALSSVTDYTELKKFASMTKLKINDYAQYIGEQSVQLHGGMGVSDELDIAHYFRRLTCICHQFGDHTYCLSQLIDTLD